MKPREIKFRVICGTDETMKTDITFMDDCTFQPGEEFLMREVLPEDFLGNFSLDEVSDLQFKINVVVDTLESLIAHSHSWVIEPDTGKILSKVHGEYRSKLEEALTKIEALK